MEGSVKPGDIVITATWVESSYTDLSEVLAGYSKALVDFGATIGAGYCARPVVSIKAERVTDAR
jgi:hypothetical protein